MDNGMQQLAEEERDTPALVVSSDMSYRDIAEAIEIPEGTVGSRLNRARRELQQHLADLGW